MRQSIRAPGIVLALTVLLAACATQTGPTTGASGTTSNTTAKAKQSVYAAQQAYVFLGRQEASLLTSHRIVGAPADTMRSLDNATYGALRPLVAAADANQPISNAALASLQGALQSFQSFVVANGGLAPK